MMKTIFVILLTLLLFAACSPKLIPVNSESAHHTTERVTDTVTKVVPDSATVRALLECDSLGRIRIASLLSENGRLLNLNMSLSDNLLAVTARGESQERVREVVRIDSIYKEVPKIIKVTETVTVFKQRQWQKWLLWLGVFYLARTAFRLVNGWKTITFKTLLKLI